MPTPNIARPSKPLDTPWKAVRSIEGHEYPKPIWKIIGLSGAVIAKLLKGDDDERRARILAATGEMFVALQTVQAAADADGWPSGWGLAAERVVAALGKAEGR